MNKYTFTLELDDQIKSFVFEDSNDTAPFTHTFQLKDITSDIILRVHGNNDLVGTIDGMVIFPLVNYLKGAPALKGDWWQFFPCYKYMKPELQTKFTAGFADTPGYAMSKHKQSIGFVCSTLQVSLDKGLNSLYFAPPVITKVRLFGCSVVDIYPNLFIRIVDLYGLHTLRLPSQTMTKF